MIENFKFKLEWELPFNDELDPTVFSQHVIVDYHHSNARSFSN
jgi:hypothetical protein